LLCTMSAMCLTRAARIERMRCVSDTSRTLHIATYHILCIGLSYMVYKFGLSYMVYSKLLYISCIAMYHVAMCLTRAARIERMQCVSSGSRTWCIASCCTYNVLLCHTWYTATCRMQCIAMSYIACSILLCTMYSYVLCNQCASHTRHAPQVAIQDV